MRKRQGIEVLIGELVAAGWPSEAATVGAVLRAAVCYTGYESSAPWPLELAKNAFWERPEGSQGLQLVVSYGYGASGA